MNKHYWWISTALVVIGLLAAEVAFGQSKNAGEIGQHITGQGTGVASGLKIIIMVMGFGFAGFGLAKLIGSFKSHEPKGMPIAMVVVGALMLVLPNVIGTTTQSVMGTEASGLSDLGVGGNNP